MTSAIPLLHPPPSRRIGKPSPTFLGALKNIGRGIYIATAKFAGYDAAHNTATTKVGQRYGNNPNSTINEIERKALAWTAQSIAKNSAIGAAYLASRQNYCSALMQYVPSTGDTGLDTEITQYLHGSDGCSGVFGSMGVDCSMQDAFSRSADLETPVMGDAGLIIWRDDSQNIRLIEFSFDQLGALYETMAPISCALRRGPDGELKQVSGNECVYFAGRYMKGADCIAYKVFERTNSYYANPRIYAAQDVIYFRDPASFRGLRGVTIFANALRHMQKGEDMLQAALSAAQRQARTAMIVKNNSGSPDMQDVDYDTELSTGRITYFEREIGEPNVEYYYPGDDATFQKSLAPGPEIIQGVETADERVAIALRMNYAWLISATKVGGAPSRLEVNKVANEFQRIQRCIHKPRLKRISDLTLMDALARALITPPRQVSRDKFLAGRWMLPISPTVDAFREGQEDIKMVRAGLEAPQDIIAETNRDVEDVIRKSREWSVKVAMAVEDANRELIAAGYKPTVTAQDIAQTTDNPQTAAVAEEVSKGTVSVTPTGSVSK